ncbi:HlyD family secretion protein [Marinomonas communis]|uniref:Membrane fusion protein (Multidrug efflux system) n=1 Tax=Marinomonas communis TaxID=28254 RepID=A0A4R6X4J3_9GAMM|nr:HlyD family secretion protein [Marinomonas communis]TDR13882.1 membrane fusion protein (multidrug efflux system) [Marinomonas communis]
MSESNTPAVEPKQVTQRNKRRLLLFVVPVVAVAASAYVYLHGGRYVETDNAFVKNDKTMITAEVSGSIQTLAVKENQAVEKGALLFAIDPVPYQTAVAQAQAQLEQVRIELLSQQAAYEEKEAEITLAQSTFAYNQRDEKRQADLLKQHYISDSQYDASTHTTKTSRLQIDALEKDLRRLREALGGDASRPVTEHPSYQAAQAQLEQAKLNLSHVQVYAPANGIVTNVPTSGEYITTGASAMVLVANQNPWIEANFTEKDMTYMKPGQTVEVEVDAYPGVTWKGTVESISPATGSEFSVIPAENATGNWVKVTQRVPVRIHIDANDNEQVLRAGLSTLVTVDTEHQTSLLGVKL